MLKRSSILLCIGWKPDYADSPLHKNLYALVKPLTMPDFNDSQCTNKSDAIKKGLNIENISPDPLRTGAGQVHA